MTADPKNKTVDDQNTLDIRSLEQAEKLVSSIEGKPEKKEEICYKIVDSIMHNRQEGKEIIGSGDAFHNFSVSIIRSCSDYLTAWEIVQLGRTIHPGNVDLLADSLRYGYNCGKIDECRQYYQELKRIDFSRWNCRAFSFAIDYLLYLTTDQGVISINQDSSPVMLELEAIVKKFQELFPENDDSRFREYEMFNKRNDSKNAVAVLEKAISDLDSCPKCQLRYADLKTEQGKYEDAIEAILNLCDDPNAMDSVNMAYTYFLKGRIQVALINKDQRNAVASEGPETVKKRRSLFAKPTYNTDEVLATYDSFRLSLAQEDGSERTNAKVINAINTLYEKTKVEIPADLRKIMDSVTSE